MGFEMNGQGFSTGGGFSFGQQGGFSTQGEQADDPLADVEYTDNLAVDCGREFDALQKGFADRAKAERKRFKQATDSEYWFAVCFESREEKEKFLKAAGVVVSMMGDKYIDGRKLAQVLGVDMG